MTGDNSLVLIMLGTIGLASFAFGVKGLYAGLAAVFLMLGGEYVLSGAYRNVGLAWVAFVVAGTPLFFIGLGRMKSAEERHIRDRLHKRLEQWLDQNGPSLLVDEGTQTSEEKSELRFYVQKPRAGVRVVHHPVESGPPSVGST